MKIGIYGGSFNPFHIGHGIIANYVSQWGGVDEVWVLPTPCNPLKQDEARAVSDYDRLEMARLGIKGCDRVKVSDFEFSLSGPWYSYNTLSELQKKFPQHEFRLIIGGDNWDNFYKWKEPEKIIEEFGLIVYPRPGENNKKLTSENVIILDNAPQVMMSSTFLRASVSQGRNIINFVVPEVAAYIEEKKLYRS